ncbi:RidA family protein [Gordonia sp. TBRC 11910]|uniref:RidA family protein n=1 Tax=Gordonia asplenii TaxID=2725283 RepID=A0A848L2R5_9ACTN|nr:RidA family protein [Gordonia asplenii]NMO05310.1 RidA family protein [Gordonia asplenii]
MTIELLRPAGLVRSPAFSHIAVIPPGATTIIVGGQNAVDADGTLVGPDDVAAQVRKVMSNLITALDAAGAGLQHVVHISLVLAPGVDITAGYGAAVETLGTLETPPLVSALFAELGVPGALVELSATAAIMR